VDGGLLSGDGRQTIGELDGGSRRACSLALRCALEVAERVRDLGIEVRAGVHAGECVIIEGKYVWLRGRD
jgi:class 3 adenylate cyclase